MKKNVPFFAKFLEGQNVLDAEGMRRVTGGERTKKWPSDDDESFAAVPPTDDESL